VVKGVPWRLIVSPPPGTAGSRAFISPGATGKKWWNIHRPPSSSPSSSTGATGGADGAHTGNRFAAQTVPAPRPPTHFRTSHFRMALLAALVYDHTLS
jgi:hypothetical protein